LSPGYGRLADPERIDARGAHRLEAVLRKAHRECAAGKLDKINHDQLFWIANYTNFHERFNFLVLVSIRVDSRD
jgi:hypothetical protein